MNHRPHHINKNCVIDSYNIKSGEMSVYSGKSRLSSILKTYSPAERERAKMAVFNKVRFEMPKSKGIIEVVNAAKEDNFQPLNEFVAYLGDSELNVSLI